MEPCRHEEQDSSVRLVTLFHAIGPLNSIDRCWVSHRHRIDHRQWEKFDHVRASPLLPCTDVLTFDPGVA